MPSSRSLHVTVVGSSPAPPLVAAHGFTQSGAGWGSFGDALAEGRQLLAVDLPGHGQSASVAANLEETAFLVVEATASIRPEITGSGFDLLGYSLGGRVALHVALSFPDLVRRLMLLSTTAGIADPEARGCRHEADDRLADELEESDDVGEFLERWLGNPMFASFPDPEGERHRRLRQGASASGFARSLRLAGTGVQEPLWDRLDELSMPVLLVCGTTDLRFSALGARMAAMLPNAARTLVPGAGHAVHLEQPHTTARIIAEWLRATEPNQPGDDRSPATGGRASSSGLT